MIYERIECALVSFVLVGLITNTATIVMHVHTNYMTDGFPEVCMENGNDDAIDSSLWLGLEELNTK